MQRATPPSLMLALLAACAAPETAAGEDGEARVPAQSADVVQLATADVASAWVMTGEPELSRECFPLVQVSPVTMEDGRIAVLVANPGDVPLEYAGLSGRNPQHYEEVLEDGRWERGAWQWCGTGLEPYELDAGESRTFAVRFSGDGGRRRLCTWFREKGTDRTSFVVLAEQ